MQKAKSERLVFVQLHAGAEKLSQSPAIRFNCLSIEILQCGPKRFIAQIVKQPVTRVMTPSPVKSQPLPIATIKGSLTIVPTHEKMFRTKLLRAIP